MYNVRFVEVNKTLGFISISIVQLQSRFRRNEFQSLNRYARET